MIIIPVWFYGFDAAMYFISALIGFLISFYFHRLFSISSEKTHMYLHLGFLILSTGFLALSVSDAYSYLTYSSCHHFFSSCMLSILDDIFSLDDYVYLIYFGFSLAAYALFIRAYLGEYFSSSKKFLLAFASYLIIIFALTPVKESIFLWYSYNGYFHITAFLMLAFVSFKNIANYAETKRFNSFIVAFSFSMISLFHLLHIFVSLSGSVYVMAHIFLLIGFISLLAMVLRINAIVKKSGKRGYNK